MVTKALKSYDEYCKAHKIRASEPRRLVYEIILRNEKPLTAYEVLEKLGKSLQNPKPPTAYRALESLGEHGFIHRIESLNSYISCGENHQHSGSQFMICDHCGKVEEIHLCSVPESLSTQAKKQKFVTKSWNVELHGLCVSCA